MTSIDPSSAFATGGLNYLNPVGAFWRGTDGNVWVSGDQGTNSAGAWDDASSDYWATRGYELINDPKNTSNTLSATDSNYSSGSSQDVAYLDSQKSLYERLLGDVDRFQSGGLKDLENSYTDSTNRANTQRSRALEDYQTQRDDSQREKTSALDTVDRNSRTLNDSLRKMLGQASGTGSSAYMYAAPNAVAKLASNERGGVVEDYGVNERNLVTAENRAKTDFEQLLEDLATQRQTNKQSLLTGFDTERQTINNSLAQIAAERAGLMGGDPLSATAPYRNAYLGLQDKITSYPDRFRTNVTPQSVQVDPVQLRDYTVDRQAINANRTAGQSTHSPYAQFLNRQRDEEERL